MVACKYKNLNGHFTIFWIIGDGDTINLLEYFDG